MFSSCSQFYFENIPLLLSHKWNSDVCHRWLSWELLPDNTSSCGPAVPWCHRRGLVLLPCDPNMHSCTSHAEAPHHAHSCNLPGPSICHWGTDQGIQRGRSQSAGGNSVSFIYNQNQVVGCADIFSFFSILHSRWNIIILWPRRGAQSALCPLPYSTLRPVLVTQLSIHLDQRWKSQTPSTPHWTASSAMMPSKTSGAALWQSLASSSMLHWLRRCQFIIHCTSVTCPLIRWAIKWMHELIRHCIAVCKNTVHKWK